MAEIDYPVAKAIGGYVAEERGALEWSQQHLADQCQAVGAEGGLPGAPKRESVAKLETGRGPLTVDNLYALAGALGRDPADLLPNIDDFVPSAAERRTQGDARRKEVATAALTALLAQIEQADAEAEAQDELSRVARNAAKRASRRAETLRQELARRDAQR